MLLRLWTFPMNVLGWLLVKTSGCTKNTVTGDWHAPENGWLDRWLKKKKFDAITPSYTYIIFRYGIEPTMRLYKHEFVHAWQHRKYGPFFLPVYFWYCLMSYINGTEWYRGNKLERQARGEVRENQQSRDRPN